MINVVLGLELFVEDKCFYLEVILFICWVIGLVIMFGIVYLMRDYFWRYF